MVKTPYSKLICNKVEFSVIFSSCNSARINCFLFRKVKVNSCFTKKLINRCSLNSSFADKVYVYVWECYGDAKNMTTAKSTQLDKTSYFLQVKYQIQRQNNREVKYQIMSQLKIQQKIKISFLTDCLLRLQNVAMIWVFRIR